MKAGSPAGTLPIVSPPAVKPPARRHTSGRRPARPEVIARAARVLGGGVKPPVAQTHEPFQELGGPTHPAIGQAMRLFEAGLAHRWTLTELATQLHLGPRLPGAPVQGLHRPAPDGLPGARLRAEHVAALLLHSDKPVTCIGREVGWSDQNYFARRFKAHYGMSATTYRARFAAGASHLETGGKVVFPSADVAHPPA